MGVSVKTRAAAISTYAPGHMLVSTNSGILRRASVGLEVPRVPVMPSATSKDIYVVAAKKAATPMWKGWGKGE